MAKGLTLSLEVTWPTLTDKRLESYRDCLGVLAMGLLSSTDVYHVTFIWPEGEEVAGRLVPEKTVLTEQCGSQLRQYHSEAHSLARIYHNCLKTIDADQPHTDVFDQGKRLGPESLTRVRG